MKCEIVESEYVAGKFYLRILPETACEAAALSQCMVMDEEKGYKVLDYELALTVAHQWKKEEDHES